MFAHARDVANVLVIRFPVGACWTVPSMSSAAWAEVHRYIPPASTAPIILLGYSMGGFIVEVMATSAKEPCLPRVAGVIMLGSFLVQGRTLGINHLPDLRAMIQDHADTQRLGRSSPTTPRKAHLRYMFPQSYLRAVSPLVRHTLLPQFIRTQRLPVRARVAQIAAVVAWLVGTACGAVVRPGKGPPEIRVPVLMILGDNDIVVPPAAAKIEHVPTVRTVILPGVGHGLLVQSMEPVSALIGDFVAEHAAGWTQGGDS